MSAKTITITVPDGYEATGHVVLIARPEGAVNPGDHYGSILAVDPVTGTSTAMGATTGGSVRHVLKAAARVVTDGRTDTYPGRVVEDSLYGYTLIGLDGHGLPGSYETSEEAEGVLTRLREAARGTAAQGHSRGAPDESERSDWDSQVRAGWQRTADRWDPETLTLREETRRSDDAHRSPG